MLRPLIFVVALAAAAPASAQLNTANIYRQQVEGQAADAAARQRDIALSNELSRLQVQAQTSQTLSDLSAARVLPVVPTVPTSSSAPPPKIDTSKLTQIPDAALADSDAKVRAAADNRR